MIRIARERADQLLETQQAETPVGSAAAAEGAHEAAKLSQERSDADLVLSLERQERKRSHADFLAVERDATDRDLVGERAQADTVVAARDEFLAVVSHDLRGYLNALSMSIQLLGKATEEVAVAAPAKRTVDTSRRLVMRMNRLINDLLDVSSIEAGKLSIVPSQIDLSQLIRETRDAFEPVATAKRVLLVEECAPLKARVDGDRLLQVLANLVSNAIKFTPAGGRIVMRCRREGDETRLEIADSGPGISPEALPTIFDRYRQVSRDRRGLGLGLYISKQIIDAHGGRMWVESSLGAGSTFSVALLP